MSGAPVETQLLSTVPVISQSSNSDHACPKSSPQSIDWRSSRSDRPMRVSPWSDSSPLSLRNDPTSESRSLDHSSLAEPKFPQQYGSGIHTRTLFLQECTLIIPLYNPLIRRGQPSKPHRRMKVLVPEDTDILQPHHRRASAHLRCISTPCPRSQRLPPAG